MQVFSRGQFNQKPPKLTEITMDTCLVRDLGLTSHQIANIYKEVLLKLGQEQFLPHEHLEETEQAIKQKQESEGRVFTVSELWELSSQKIGCE